LWSSSGLIVTGSVSATSFSGGDGLWVLYRLTAGLTQFCRTDGTIYPVWGVNAGTQAFSCTAVNIQSSTGTLNAAITRVQQVIITDTGGVDKYRML
jgi:N-methylhydantoinase B/oxoprolinase/acetone carboxylase alpha subunit